MGGGSAPSGPLVITLLRERAQALPQRPARRPMDFDRTDVDCLGKDPARPQADRAADQGRFTRRLQQDLLREPYGDPLEVPPARRPEPWHRICLLRRVAGRRNLRPAQLRPDGTGPAQGRAQSRADRLGNRHPEREDFRQCPPGQPGNGCGQEGCREKYPTISKSWGDTGFKNSVVKRGARLGIDVEVVKRDPETRGFDVAKRRWVVERNIGWMMMHRRLVRDDETLPATSEAMIHVASIDILTKRITNGTAPTWRVLRPCPTW